VSIASKLTSAAAVLMAACCVLLPLIGGVIGGSLIASGTFWAALAGVLVIAGGVFYAVRHRRSC
jgi:LPXTG-motif cell wall-anchored protein